MTDSPANDGTLTLTARIVAAHVANNSVTAEMLPTLIQAVFQALNDLGRPPREAVKPRPAVPPRESVFDEYLVCLEDGKKQKTLKRHLQSAHGLTPKQYRTRWDLLPTYPMVAPSYARRRSQLAKNIGLGTKRAVPD